MLAGQVPRKVAGIDDAVAVRSPVGSGTTLPWLIKHMARAEITWVLYRFAGQDTAIPDDTPQPGDSLADAVDFCGLTWARVDAVAALRQSRVWARSRWQPMRRRHLVPYRSATRRFGWRTRREALMGGQDDSMLVSDAERDATLKILGDHAAVGRLSLDELEERADRALTVRTRGELTALTIDLPDNATLASSRAAALVENHPPVRRTVAIMGGASRRGPFRAVRSLSAIAVMGGDNIDLREAQIDGGELTVKVFSLIGVVNIYVPDTMEVELGGFCVLGANSEQGGHRRRQAKAPVIRVRGFNLMGRTTVFRVPVQALTLELAEARHQSVVAGHRHPPEAASARRRRSRASRHHRSHHHH